MATRRHSTELLRSASFGIALSVLLVTPTDGSLASASEGPPVPLSRLIELTKLAFAGTVRAVTTREIDGIIVRDVRFNEVSVGRGHERGPEIVVTTRGGAYGGEILVSPDFPEFTIGERYIVLSSGTGSHADWYMPIVGFKKGLFQVRRSLGRAIVADHHGRPILRIGAGHLAVLDSTLAREGVVAFDSTSVQRIYWRRPNGDRARVVALEVYPTALDPGTRVTEEEFLDWIRSKPIEREREE
jgi:hypothetical protein